MAKGRTQTYYDNNPDAKRKKKKYDTEYQKTKKQKKRRAKRNASRKKAIMSGKISPNSNKDIHHRDGNPNNTSSSNLKAESKSQNRGRK